MTQYLRPVVLALMAFCIFSCSSPTPAPAVEEPAVEAAAATPPPAEDLYGKLKAYCGKAYAGKMIHDNTNSDFYNGKPISIKLEYCNDNEISIPYQVGEDGSITWKLSQSENGINLKHEVMKGGNEAKISKFGGTAVIDESKPLSLSFPADDYTKQLIPVAAKNTWKIELDEDRKILTYVIMRGGTRHFQVEFDMQKPSNI